jgi:AhpD family alkylhydroperoxidase
MEARLKYWKTSPGVYKALRALQEAVNASGLEKRLIDLICLRVSQINGCAFCIDMHSKDLRAEGESEERLYLLEAWRESPFYTDRERAALAWSESLTKVSEDHVPDKTFEEAGKHFTDDELVKLTLAVVAINGWNRFGIAFRTPPGRYQPAHYAEAISI